MSKFQDILKARQEPVVEVTPTERKDRVEFSGTQKAKLSDRQTSESSRTQKSKPQRGRPPAKRSDPDYLQVTAYIRKQTHLKAKIRLLHEGRGQEFSELIEELLGKWLG
jgi:hypothetical protein